MDLYHVLLILFALWLTLRYRTVCRQRDRAQGAIRSLANEVRVINEYYQSQQHQTLQPLHQKVTDLKTQVELIRKMIDQHFPPIHVSNPF